MLYVYSKCTIKYLLINLILYSLLILRLINMVTGEAGRRYI